MTTKVRSKDGTMIAYDKSGRGPAVIIVDGAFCSRLFGPSKRLTAALAPRFTVYAYDRRGRGQSGDTEPYAPGREVEDIAALVRDAGGSASLVGLSSGGALALEAAAAGLPISRIVAYEPPYVDETGERGGAQHEARLKALLAEGNRAGAVNYFVRDMVGVPAFAVFVTRLMPWLWRKLEAAAHTLPYDAAVMRDFKIPRARFASIAAPTLVMNGSKTKLHLKQAAEDVASVIPGAQHRTLAGQAHNVNPDVLAKAATEFLK
jgi:pimeloyl-ACP methyl ester carboxylesterase